MNDQLAEGTPDGHEPDESCWCEPEVVRWEPLLLVHDTDDAT